jgi:hypothetical protein
MKKRSFQQRPWCRCRAISLSTPDQPFKPVSWQVYVCEAMNAVKDVVLDVLDVLQIRDVSEINDCGGSESGC